MLAASAVVVLIASIAVGPDNNWDLRNYHYNNGRALVTGSFRNDVVAAGLQSYLHPLIDAPIYIAVELFGGRWGLILWCAVVQWFCYLAVWRLTGAIGPIARSWTLRALALLAVATGSGAFSIAFTTFGDWIVAALLCEATTRIVRSVSGPPTDDRRRWSGQRDLALAGVFVGLAMSVKVVSATFAIAIGAGLLVCLGLRALLITAAGAVTCYLVVAGPWMLMLASRYGNPWFPFYNSVFRSSSAPRRTFDDERYGAQGLLDILRFPVNMFRGGVTYTELPIRDWRFLALMLLIGVWAVLRPRQRLLDAARSLPLRFVAVTLGVAYLSWIVAFGYHRYFLFGELLTSLVLTVIVIDLLGDLPRTLVVGVVLIAVGIQFQDFPAYEREDPFDNAQLDAAIDLLPTTPTHVLFSAPPPLSYLSEAFDRSTNFASIFAFQIDDFRLAGPLAEEYADFITDGLADDSLYVITEAGATALPPPFDTVTLGTCTPFDSVGRPLQLCAAHGAA